MPVSTSAFRIPRRFRTLINRQRHIFSNIGWLLADRGIRMIGGLVVGVWVARYLGPDPYGLLNYSIAFVSLFSALATLGLDRIVIKELVIDSGRRPDILGTAFCLKFAGGILAFLFSIAFAQLSRNDWKVTGMVAIVAGSSITQAADVIDFWFQSQVRSKFSVLARNGAFVAFSAIKAGLILSHAPVTAFAFAVSGESLLSAVALVLLFARRDGNPFIWRFKRKMAGDLLRQSWPLLVAYMAYLLYARIDQIMLGSMVGDKPLGIYSASAKISDIAVALLLIFGSTIFPKLIDLYEKDREGFFRWFENLTSSLSWAALLLFLSLLFAGKFLVGILFGSAFMESAKVLNLQAIGLIFMYNGGLRSAFLTISGNQKILSATSLISAAFNIAMNLMLIPRFGVYGAAVSGILVEALALFILNAFFKPTRRIFFIQLRGLLFFPALWKLIAAR